MKLRAKIILAISLTVLGMVALAHWASQGIVMQGFSDVEARAMQAQLARVANELRREGELLGSTTFDYARWDELYEFAAEHSEKFQSETLTDSNLKNLRLNAFLIFNHEGNLIGSHATDWRNSRTGRVSRQLIELVINSPMLLQQDEIRPTSGVINLPECPMLIATAPITNSRGEGPPRGTIVMGRWLNPQEVTAMGKQIGAELLLFPRSSARSSRFKAITEQLASGQSMVIENDSRDHQTGYMTLPDIFGNPALVARIDAPRLIYLQGQASQRYLVLALLASGAMSAFAVWCAVHWFILRRMAKIQEAVVTVGESQQLGHRVVLDGQDEMADLAAAINATLDAVQSSESARRQADERLRQIVDSIEDVVWSMDPDAKHVLYVSPSVAWMFGVRAAAAMEGPGPWQTLVIPEDQERVHRGFVALRGGGVLDLCYRVKCLDGQVRHIHNRARLIWDSEGQALRIDGICTDISESQRLTEELKRAHQQIVNDAHRAGKAEIATSVLHNVGNALNGVNVSTSVLHGVLRRSVVGDFRRVLGLLVEQAGRLTEFIQHDPRGRSIPDFIRVALPLLDGEQTQLVREVDELHTRVEHIQRIIQAQQENARSLLLVEDTSVQELIVESLKICGDRLNTHGIELIQQLDFNPQLRVAKSQLAQVLVNLINNAIDAVKNPNVTDKNVSLFSRPAADGGVTIIVQDSGSGIDPADKTRIFNHGFTTKTDGHGFGLHYCALAMTSIGGTIHVESAGLGQGSQFIVTFPAQHPKNQSATPKTKPGSIAAATVEVSTATAQKEFESTDTSLLLLPNLVTEMTPAANL